jgi:hypothetical protein
MRPGGFGDMASLGTQLLDLLSILNNMVFHWKKTGSVEGEEHLRSAKGAGHPPIIL